MTNSNLDKRLQRLLSHCKSHNIPTKITNNPNINRAFHQLDLELTDGDILSVTLKPKTLGQYPTAWQFEDNKYIGDDEELILFINLEALRLSTDHEVCNRMKLNPNVTPITGAGINAPGWHFLPMGRPQESIPNNVIPFKKP